jgi:XXXCH domain-containing protein
MGGWRPDGGAAPAQADPAVREKYRQLKKTLKADFKTLRAAAEDGRSPGAERLESFLALAEIAAADKSAVAGHGREEYAAANRAFWEDCQALREAVGRGPEALAEVLARLERRKAACHAQFK